MQTGADRYGYLDSLLFIASALVVVQHLFERRPGPLGDWLIPLGPGVAGVALFFFISGYVIPLSAGRSLDWRSFAVRRIFRIYPLFLAALSLILATAIFGLLPNWAGMPHAPPLRWAANLLLVQDFVGAKAFLGVSWTLIIELIWYGLFAASTFWFGARAATVLDTAIPVVLVALAMLSLALWVRVPLGRPTVIYAAIIGFQCFRHSRGEISSRALGMSFARFAAVAVLYHLVSFGVFKHQHILLAQALGPWTMAAAIFAAVVLIPGLRNHRWLNHGPLLWLGAISFSIYLLHPVANAVADAFASGPLRVPVALALALTLGLSVAAYRLVERPGIALGRKVANALPRAGQAVPA